ncbi:phosphatase PAP2 family protein, partial [Petrachloros mirabilis]
MNWDDFLFRAINGLAGQSAFLDEFALDLSRSSLLWVPGVALSSYWLWLSWREAILGAPALAATIGIADFLGARLKDLIARPRPCMSLLDIQQVEAACGKVFSFPSNHAINTAVAAAFLQVLYPRSGWVSWPLVGLI